LISGVQDGILQGFEDFKSIARVRITTIAITLAAAYPVATRYGLNGILLLLLGAPLVRWVILREIARRHAKENKIPASGEGITFREIIFGFSLPSMLVSLMVGAIGWIGLFILSRQSNGFDSVALVNVGQQWKGPILLLASSLGTVAIPAFSRYAQHADDGVTRRLLAYLLWANGIGALCISVVLMLLSSWILSLYGQAFMQGVPIFCVLVSSTVPTVLSDVYMQKMVGRAELWKVFFLHIPLVAVSVLGYLLLIPQWHGEGYAVVSLITACLFLVFVIVTYQPLRGRSR
jgi:O-antigen/teichoic acid export membrane protein